MQQQNVKSATTAGLLGIFLGAFGAHNWYLGEKNKGIIHVCMMSGGILVEIIAAAVLPNALSFSMLIQMAWLFTILTGIAGLVMSASAIWGLVEGITIISQGDAGLARKGFAVAQPMNQNYGYPQNNQSYGPQPNYNQPNHNQPYSSQPGFAQPPMNDNFSNNSAPQMNGDDGQNNQTINQDQNDQGGINNGR